MEKKYLTKASSAVNCGAKVVEQIEQSQPEAVKESMFSRFHFYKSDLITLWKAAGNPFQGVEISFSASVVIVILNLIANILILDVSPVEWTNNFSLWEVFIHIVI